jgi:type IV pilus assembly protein PilM
MPCVGVDISDNSLKYMAFRASSLQQKEKKLLHWGDISIPSGVVQRGMVEDVGKLVGVLKEFKTETRAEFVRLSLPEERAYLFETEIKSTVPFKEIRSLMEFRLEENVPIPSREVLFDFRILPKQEHKNTLTVAVAAYARETIELYYEACQGAGLFPVSFEIEAQAMARAMVPDDMSGAVMVVDLGKTRTGIGIVYQKTLLYTSTIDLGGDTISAGLRKTLGDDIAESELTKIKNQQGLVGTVDSSDVRDSILMTLSVIKDEIATRMQYWHLHNSNAQERRITSLILCGGSANLHGLPEYLSDTLGVPSVRGNVWEHVFSLDHTVPPIRRRYSLGYATAVGLALRTNV